jgi:DNA-binding CsgD family transcriptional regulator
MPQRLANAALQFADDVTRLQTPNAVLVALQNMSRITVGVNVMGTWNLPRYFENNIDTWRDGETLFLHPDVPGDLWPSYQKQFAIHGFSALALKARSCPTPFTFAEAETETNTRKVRNWIFDFFRSYNIQDGLYCTYGEWSLVFISNKLLALRPFERAFLATAAQVAVGRIEAIVKNPCRGPKKSTKTDLTRRELEVVQQRALLGCNAAIAKSLNISLKTVDVHLRSARKKLKTDDTAIALLEACKRGLIEY